MIICVFSAVLFLLLKSQPNMGIFEIKGVRCSIIVESFWRRPLSTTVSPERARTCVVRTFSDVGGGFPIYDEMSAPRLETEASTVVVIMPSPETQPLISRTRPETISRVTPE